MKLGTLKNETRDGALCVVARDLKVATVAYDVAPTLQAALDDWDFCAPRLETLYRQANTAPLGSRWFEVDFAKFAAPLPRAYQWMDGSAYLSHAERLRKARGADGGGKGGDPRLHADGKELREEPMMYQGASDSFLGPRDDIAVEREGWDIDLEGEIAVVVGDVPMGLKREKAGEHIRLLMLANDVSLRGLVAADLAKGFGFLHSKTWTTFSPVRSRPRSSARRGTAARSTSRSSFTSTTSCSAAPTRVRTWRSTSPGSSRTRRGRGRWAPAPSSARARSRTRTPRSACAASPRRVRSNRYAARTRRRRISSSATASRSRCATPRAVRSSARSSSG